MKDQKKTYVGPAVFFERLADGGWPEDAGLWPLDGFTSPPIKCPDERVQRVSQFVKSLMRNSSRMSRRLAITEE